ncbi:MAG TPA: hypothetical protein VIL34_11725 [Actinopolymorphaceae bacterium]
MRQGPGSSGTPDWAERTEPIPLLVPDDPPRARPVYPWALWRFVLALLPLEAVCAVVYGVFALGPRRGIFAELAADPVAVTREAAARSDMVNTILFLIAGVVTLIAFGLLLWWQIWSRRALAGSPSLVGLFGVPWCVTAVCAFLAVAVALALHAGTAPDQIAVGYVSLGVGALLLGIVSGWAFPVVRRSGREAARQAADSRSEPSSPIHG